MRYFDRMHPISALIYFLSVLFITMLSSEMTVTAVSLICGICFFAILKGTKSLLSSLAYQVPLMLIIALANPIFVHRGETVLFFVNSTPITLEAAIYGAAAALKLTAVIYWCRCLSEIITDDKFVYIFGRILPKLSMTLSVTLGLIPKIKRKYQEISSAQTTLGIYSGKGYTDRLKHKLRIMSILVTNVLETSIDTADAMKARGYGLRGRTGYSIYRYSLSDALYTVFTVATAALCISLTLGGYSDVQFYPSLSYSPMCTEKAILYLSLILLTGSATFLEIKENILWRYLRSKI